MRFGSPIGASINIDGGTVDVTVSGGTLNISGGNIQVENVAGDVLQTGDAIDPLGTFVFGAATRTKTVTISTLSKVYSAILVAVPKPNSTPAGWFPLFATSYIGAIGNKVKFSGSFCPIATFTTVGTTATYQAMVPCANEPTTSVTVKVWATTTLPGVAITYKVYGITGTPMEVLNPGRSKSPSVFGAVVSRTTPIIKGVLIPSNSGWHVNLKWASIINRSNGFADMMYFLPGPSGGGGTVFPIGQIGAGSVSHSWQDDAAMLSTGGRLLYNAQTLATKTVTLSVAYNYVG